MFYEIAMPKGGTHYYLSVTPRPLSDTSMTKDALQKFKLSKSVAQNRKIAAHILHRHEQGESIVDAAAAIAQDKLFPGRTEDALLKRWRQWRKWAEDFGSHYYLTGSPESPYVTVVIDGALPFTPDARPLPPATGGRPKNRRNVIAKN